MKATMNACHCCVDRAPCHRYMADPERHCVCSECGHTAACHQSGKEPECRCTKLSSTARLTEGITILPLTKFLEALWGGEYR